MTNEITPAPKNIKKPTSLPPPPPPKKGDLININININVRVYEKRI
jgi:hypothetical protein